MNNFIEVKEKLIDMYNFNKDIKVELTPCGVKPILDYIDSKDKEIERLNNIIDKAIELLSKYNDKESNYYVPIDKILSILYGGKDDMDK